MQLTALTKVLTHEKCPALRNLAVLPIHLSPERDTELLRITEQRVPQFSHDLAPDYLRTKLEPDVEQRMTQLEIKAANMTYEMAQVCHNFIGIFLSLNFISAVSQLPLLLSILETSISIHESYESCLGYSE